MIRRILRYSQFKNERTHLTYLKQSDGLEELHRLPVAVKINSKKEMAKGIWLLFSDKVTVKFIKRDGITEQVTGRWCNVCK
jgi:hypothetical protein